MINIVHPFFRVARCACNTRHNAVQVLAALALISAPSIAGAAKAMPGTGEHRGPDETYFTLPGTGITIPCNILVACPKSFEPDARPFEETHGRPCAYRWRYTPAGKSRVRVCF